jgi:dipeptidyl aminopeptidase/acylaminoacyl peptidase
MKQYLFDQFTAIRLHTGLAYSHDGKQIAFIANTSGQHNLWIVPSGGGAARQLTAFEDQAVRGLAWSNDDSQIAFLSDSNGNEFYQVYLVDAQGSWPRRITDHLDAQYSLAGWTPDDKALIYSGNDREPSEIDPLIHNLETGEIQRLMTGHRNYAANLSPDGKYLNVVQVDGNIEQNIFVVEVESGEAALATPHEGDTIFFAGEWKPDSSGFFLTTNQGREFDNLAFYDIASGKREWVFETEADVENAEVSKDGKTLIIRTNEGGRSKFHGINLETGEKLNLPELPVGVVSATSLAPDASKIACLYASAREAFNLYEFDLKTGAMTPLSQSMLGGIDLNDLVDPELVYYDTFDGQRIPAWLYKPKMQQDKYPVLLSIHGGPEAQERPQYNYSGLYQYLLNRGIAVLAPNIRGSTGFGITYQTMIHRDWGGAELKDIEHAAKYLQAQDWVDTSKIAVYGGSFGGFATLSAVTRLPDYWAAAVDLVGPSNLVTFAKSVPPHWKPFMKKWVGDPEEDYDFLMERSPITYAANIKAPLLIIQGANDPRVVKAESDQMVEVMRANGSEVTYYVDEAEGHGTTRRSNTIKWYRMIVEYLEKHLLGVQEAEPIA